MSYRRAFELRWSDCDANAHVRHTVYPELGAEVRFGWLRERGFDWKWFEAHGVSPVVLREEIDYLRELGLGEQVSVDLQAVGLSPDGARWKLRHTFYNATGEVAARVVILGGWIDLARRKLALPPEELAASFRAAEQAEDFAALPPLRR